MAEPSAHINYSFEDIQRYLQGKMSAAEMHAIEKAALHDPFLADALEGYTAIDPAIAKQHLNEINAALFSKKNASKVVAFNRKTQWLSIAALVIILAGIGVVVSLFSKSSNQDIQIAQLKNKLIKKEDLKDSTTDKINALTQKQDSTLFIAENKPKKKSQPLEKRKATEPVITSYSLEQEINMQKDEANVASLVADSSTAVAKNKTIEPAASAKLFALDTVQFDMKASAANTLPNTFSGKVLNENNKPIPYVTIESADKKTAVVSDMNGEFIIHKNDSLINVTASTIGYDSKSANLRSGNNDPIILRGISSGVNDVVVTTAGMSKKSKVSKDSASPVGGWTNFNNYVMSELNKDTANALLTNSDALVEIEFLIDNNGTPYNIKITKPLDEQHNAKAIDILKSGQMDTHLQK